MKKRLFILFVSIIFTLNTLHFNVTAYSASAYCLYDPVLNKVLASSNMNQKMAMASTTKIMTALIACELCDLDEEIEIQSKMIAVEGSSIGVQVGDIISYRCLLYGLMLESGNDAALCIALSISGNAENFAILMNQKAKKIGMKNTSFITPNGLDDKNHYSTAYDMALLSGVAMQNSTFRNIVSTKTYKAVYNKGETQRTYYNHNRLLFSLDGVDGIKTGFTKKAGRCLVTSCLRNAVRLIAVTLNASDDWNDHKELYQYGFKQYQEIELPCYNKSVKIVGGKDETVELKSETKKIYFYNGLLSFIKTKVYIPKFLYAPLKKNSKVGYIEYYYNNSLIGKSDIYPIKECKKEYVKAKNKNSFSENLKYMLKFI